MYEIENFRHLVEDIHVEKSWNSEIFEGLYRYFFKISYEVNKTEDIPIKSYDIVIRKLWITIYDVYQSFPQPQCSTMSTHVHEWSFTAFKSARVVK